MAQATTDAVDGASMSVAAAVRDYEWIQSELNRMARQSRQLRTRLAKIKAVLESFMRERNLERMSTKKGDIVVRIVERSNRVRPGRRATEQCILNTLGSDKSELAAQLISDLYEKHRVKGRTTQVFASP
jgi:hypothetical protein